MRLSCRESNCLPHGSSFDLALLANLISAFSNVSNFVELRKSPWLHYLKMNTKVAGLNSIKSPKWVLISRALKGSQYGLGLEAGPYLLLAV